MCGEVCRAAVGNGDHVPLAFAYVKEDAYFIIFTLKKEVTENFIPLGGQEVSGEGVAFWER